MRNFFEIIAVDGAQGFHLVLVDLLVIGGGDYGCGKGREIWGELLFLRSRRANLGGIVEILLLFVRHSGALGGVWSLMFAPR